MSYDELLISMAGGDGDELDAIEAAAKVLWAPLYAAIEAAAITLSEYGKFSWDEEDEDVKDGLRHDARHALEAAYPTLLALLQDHAAKLERVEVLCADRAESGLVSTRAVTTALRTAITATEASK
jgi:hypothetical protein